MSTTRFVTPRAIADAVKQADGLKARGSNRRRGDRDIPLSAAQPFRPGIAASASERHQIPADPAPNTQTFASRVYRLICRATPANPLKRCNLSAQTPFIR